ncbi:MAG: tRNA (adenosine(37)-N6)-threonylcarbamoyltransferase complex dimerization subunit type 1 TsaB [Smithellaceae bacterium]|jgi:tRNA threonylcarbamoyladenosine biosynthesis protein TsaB|nr:tRNA (adenosine(37)-N6)-threonylcarbamoyltransferase complex dimerization subunit type 1 TsaB [Smithellaceae bacterium]MDD3258651.1 tRNA (adenosine(37)-N6)-threonylcarbamoyltransferase complex dimerization subunit type 1 TsaB [Smithellaceae bacterium]MDD3848874.1 tRNA (adenosine(37)-N6)-threonylcarbamoyltransferase complex dimerization subunit type 1 TsaB [Smithellaceae bacterium]HOG11993.1 tRNA (adenosine(37)-N6)-threonylcarbamoyltransferase complex dimerization subunit type 1 TsaB [Smithell
MLTLAFDTSSKTVSVALLEDRAVLYNAILHREQNHSEVLLPAIDEACRQTGISVRDIGFFACTLGPGSFTGLRIGLSTLKGLMMATGKPAAGVSSLAALALNAEEPDAVIGSMMDAGRGQVYLAYYRRGKDGVLQPVRAPQAQDPRSVEDPFSEPVIYVGDGAVRYAGLIPPLSSPKNKMAPVEQQFISAAAVARLALEKYFRKDFLDPARCAPLYLRSVDALPVAGSSG